MLLLSPEELPQLFADVSPVSQPPSPSGSGVCEIQYANDFVVAYDYFRAIVHSREVSERVLQLTELCATLNPANYTVWQHRRFVWRQLLLITTDTKSHHEGTAAAAAAAAAVVEVNDDDDDDAHSSAPRTRTLLRTRVEYELQLASRLGGANPKTYQIWYHRRAIVEHLHELASTKPDDSDDNDGALLLLLLKARINAELEYLRTVVRADGKNYHAWSYRQFLLMMVMMMRKVPTVRRSQQVEYKDDDDDYDGDDDANMWSDELEYTSDLIDDDGRNNSAWNHRWFVLMNGATDRDGTEEAAADDAAAGMLDEHVVAREVRYALEVASIDPYNESPWRFFVALVRQHVRGLLLASDKTTSPLRDVLDMYEQQAWNVMPGASVVRGAALANEEEEEEKGAGDSAAPPFSRDVVSPHLVAAVVDVLELSWSSLSSGSGSGNETSAASAASSAAAAPARARWAVHLCTCLEEIDPIRQKYWRYRAAALQRGASPNENDDGVNVEKEKPSRKH
jgi:Protein prenyltransferase alpha subunit repeat